MKFKNFVLILALLLCLLGAEAAAEEAVNCYWQLERVQVETVASQRLGFSKAQTDVQPVEGLTAAQMVQYVRGTRTLSLQMTREANGSQAQATFTYGGVPALIPGAAAARLSLTAVTDCQDNSYYLYCTVNAGGNQILRLRGRGAWVARAFFPRKAVPGAERTLSVYAREMNGLASVRVAYVYRAMPGAMLIDTNGDIVLYDLEGNEIDRIAKTVEDILPVYADSQAEGDTLFAAERQEDGSLVIRMSPNSGLTTAELIRLIRAAAQQDETGVDAASAATALSSLKAQKDMATIYLAPGVELSDDVLAALLAAAEGKRIDTAAIQSDLEAGAVELEAQNTPTPAPITFAELKALIASGVQEEEEENSLYANEEGQGAQAVVLYGDSGVKALVLAPGLEISGSQVLEIIEKLDQACRLSCSYAETFGRDPA